MVIKLLATGAAFALPIVLAGHASAAQPEHVAAHVATNKASGEFGASGNPKAASGPGYALGRYTTECLLVINPDDPCGVLDE